MSAQGAALVVHRECPVWGMPVDLDPWRVELVPGPKRRDPSRNAVVRWLCPCGALHAVSADWAGWCHARAAGARLVDAKSGGPWDERPGWLRVAARIVGFAFDVAVELRTVFLP